MIPYVIEQSNPSDDINEPNIDTIYYSSEKDKLNEDIINNIINIMYEFCSQEYGHNLKITSYHDFCDQYWKIKEITLNILKMIGQSEMWNIIKKIFTNNMLINTAFSKIRKGLKNR